jgi:putative ABC transport system permease protein
MRLWNIVQSRLRSVFLRDRREADLREELQFHLERETERLEASGLPPETARLQALRLFGGPEQIKEACRDARGTRLVDDAIRDVRYALRGFRRTPLVACAIVATVALGLGLVVVAFTFLNALLFNVDQVPNIHEMFAVERPRTGSSTRCAARPAFSPTVMPSPVSTAASTGGRRRGRSSPATSSRCWASPPRSDGR